MIVKALKKEFRRIDKLGLKVPELNDLDDSNLRIWESQVQTPFLRPRKSSAYLNQKITDFWTVSGDEELFFQGFAVYQSRALPEPLPCMNQNGQTLMEATVQLRMSFHQDKSSVTINAENLTFTSAKDASHLCAILEAVHYYLSCRHREGAYLDDLKALILLVAVKNQLRDTVMRLLENPVSSNDSPQTNCYEHASVVASRLASQFIKNDLNDRLVQELEKDRTEISLFSWALQCGHVAVVKLLMVEGMTWSDDSKFDLSVLGLASLSGHEPVVQLILKKEAKLEIKDNRGRTALQLATSKGNLAVVRLLLREGANIKACDSKGRSPFFLAAKTGNVETMQLLLNEGVDLETTDFKNMTALLLASKKGNLKMVQQLLNEGTDVEKTDFKSMSALFLAIKKGHLEIVHLLLDAGADVGRKSGNGWGALHYAAFYDFMAAAELLVRRGVDIAGRTNKGETALHLYWMTGFNYLHPNIAFLDLLRPQLRPSHSMPHSRRPLCRTQVHVEILGNSAHFILDSPLARIDFTEAIPSGVSYKDSHIISFWEGVSYYSVQERTYFRTEMRFSIVHPEEEPLDFSVGGGQCFTFKVRILNWREEMPLTSYPPVAYNFQAFRDVLSLIPKAE
ncbi:hypothetical protein MMC22_003868 [Lobaria immixta]|nr:hypothetical protein [Lobaria immixta]